jgi:hypothetical protein
MATLSDLNRIAIVSETTPGTTPTNPAFEVLRLLSESITQSANEVESGELNDSRGLSDSIRAGAGVSGTLESYVVYDSSYIECILAVLGQTVTWPSPGASGATPQGNVRETFTYERTIRSPDLTPAGGIVANSYWRYSGVSFSSVAFSFSPNDPLTMTFGLLGGSLTLAQDTIAPGDVQGNAELPGSLYAAAAPVDALPMTGSDVTLTWSVPLDIGLQAALGNSEMTAFSINIDSQNRELDEIGTDASSVLLGKLSVGITFTAIFYDNTIKEAELIQGGAAAAALASQPDLTVTLTDSAANVLTLNFPRVKFQQVTAVTPTTNTDVVYEVEAIALVDAATLLTFTAVQG